MNNETSRDNGQQYKPDTDLMGKLSRGEPEAILALYDAYFERIYSLIYNQVARNKEAADDIVQETFIAALKSAGKFNGRSKAYTWLYSIATKKVADFYRRQKRIDKHHIQSSDGTVEPDWLPDKNQPHHDPLDSYTGNHKVQEAVSNLPLHYRQILLLKYVEEMPVAEIGQVMERSPKSVEGLLSRARQELRKALSRQNEGKADLKTT
ncbi:MAG: RNA polymerase sigma factor [Dehalococcoidales bacterium]